MPWAESVILEEVFLDVLHRSSSRILDMSLDESGSAVSEIVDLSMVDAKRSQESGSDVRSMVENSDPSIACSWLASC